MGIFDRAFAGGPAVDVASTLATQTLMIDNNFDNTEKVGCVTMSSTCTSTASVVSDLQIPDNELDGGRLGPAEPMRYRRYSNGRWQVVEGAVVRETPVTVFVDQRELVTILCTPLRVNHLVLGFLANEGIVDSLDDVALMRVCDEEATVDVRLSRPRPPLAERRTLTSGCGGAYTVADQLRDLAPVRSSLVVTPAELLALVRALQQAATLFRHCGGVHTAALASRSELLAVAEDVGRHNTIDKIRGQCLLEGITSTDCILISTGRLSSEIVAKAAKMGVPVVVSRNSPTARAVALGDAAGITLVGYARGGSITVYSHPERLLDATTDGRDLEDDDD